MGNERIGLTSEFVALIKSKENNQYEYFVSDKTRKIYSAFKKIFPEESLKRIFEDRLNLSRKFEDKITTTEQKNIIELGCGYDLKGFNLCRENPNISYVDLDFERVINHKKRTLERICENENITFPKNYHLIPMNVIRNDLYSNVANLIEGRTLVIAEGLTSYFDKEQFEAFIMNIKRFLEKSQDSEFFSHEQLKAKQNATYTILRNMIKVITLNRSHQRFRNEANLENYIKQKGFSECFIEKEGNQLFYSIKH